MIKKNEFEHMSLSVQRSLEYLCPLEFEEMISSETSFIIKTISKLSFIM